jgi:hypothetical protein
VAAPSSTKAKKSRQLTKPSASPAKPGAHSPKQAPSAEDDVLDTRN